MITCKVSIDPVMTAWTLLTQVVTGLGVLLCRVHVQYLVQGESVNMTHYHKYKIKISDTIGSF